MKKQANNIHYRDYIVARDGLYYVFGHAMSVWGSNAQYADSRPACASFNTLAEARNYANTLAKRDGVGAVQL